jgi:hypothetical protein
VRVSDTLLEVDVVELPRVSSFEDARVISRINLPASRTLV